MGVADMAVRITVANSLDNIYEPTQESARRKAGVRGEEGSHNAAVPKEAVERSIEPNNSGKRFHERYNTVIPFIIGRRTRRLYAKRVETLSRQTYHTAILAVSEEL